MDSLYLARRCSRSVRSVGSRFVRSLIAHSARRGEPLGDPGCNEARFIDRYQTPILTKRTDLTAPQIAYRMAARWRQEDYFKYAREHFALDRLVPNPAKAHAKDLVAGASSEPMRCSTDVDAAIAKIPAVIDIS